MFFGVVAAISGGTQGGNFTFFFPAAKSVARNANIFGSLADGELPAHKYLPLLNPYSGGCEEFCQGGGDT